MPLRFGPKASLKAGEMLLTDADLAGPPASSHPAGCACCIPRSTAAEALAVLFRNRAIAKGPLCRSVLADVGSEAEAALRLALIDDPVASGRFRLV